MSSDTRSDTRSDPNSRHEDLISYFERSAATVRTSLDRFEHTYVRPKLLHLRHAFQRRPVRVTFLATFAALAFFPVISFLGFSLFILASFTLLALVGALIASTIAILVFASILAFTLFTLFGISAFLTSGIISTFLFARFILHIRAEGPRSGILEWGKETKSTLYGPPLSPSSLPPPPPPHQQQHVQFDPDATLGSQDQDQEMRKGQGAEGVLIPDGSKHTKQGHKYHKDGHHYPRRVHRDHHIAMKGGQHSPGLSSTSSSTSSSSESEHEDNDRSTLASTVLVEGGSESALHAEGVVNKGIIRDEGRLRCGSIVEDSPIMVKVELVPTQDYE